VAGRHRISITERKTAVSLDISVRDLPTVHALVIRRRVPRDEIATALAESLPRVFDYAQRHGLAIAGPPFARYPEVGMGSLVIESGIIAGLTTACPSPTSRSRGGCVTRDCPRQERPGRRI
jgi:hypothetical protein